MKIFIVPSSLRIYQKKLERIRGLESVRKEKNKTAFLKKWRLLLRNLRSTHFRH